jgi:hypothetical protein
MARTASDSCGATLDERARRVYLIEELSMSGEPQSPAIVKIGQAGLDPETARRACERGNARTLVLRYCTDPLTAAEAWKVEHMAHRWLHEWALQREWFACPNTDFAQQAIARVLHHIRNRETGLTDVLLQHSSEPTVPNSPIARSVAALRAHRTRSLERGEAEKASGFEQRIERLLPRDHTQLNPKQTS